jgi:porphobilinogen synthase
MEFPLHRPRRLRSAAFSRKLVQETSLTPSDLIWPLFFRPVAHSHEPIASMPGVMRLGHEELLRACEKALKLSIPAVALFPVIEDSLKDLDASQATRPDGPVQEAIRMIKKRFPELGVISDVALDPFTSHGQDGIIDESGYVLNDTTVAVLCRQALSHAEAGADVVAPSDMMDGRVLAIRKTLEECQHTNTLILSYTAKYASYLYGPFRDAVAAKLQAGSDKKTYQLNPANAKEALYEAKLDLAEGADILMVKPAGMYLDIIYRLSQMSDVPVFAYQVSGEYAMIEAACEKNYLKNHLEIVTESLVAIKRAGATAILTYYAPMIAEHLGNR